jgi:molybdenum cofactor cytidylyltransferase
VDQEPTQRTVAVVLAAGAATRFGATKPLAEFEGRPLIDHVLDAARAGGADRCVVVVGHDAQAITTAVARHDDVEVVVNPEHGQGQATSVQVGIAAVAQDPEAAVAVMLLADQPGISPGVVRQVVAALEDGADVARARYDDGPGHPVAFPRRTWPRLTDDLAGDEGARQLFGDLDVAHVLVPGPMPADVDRPEDLDRLVREAADRSGDG